MRTRLLTVCGKPGWKLSNNIRSMSMMKTVRCSAISPLTSLEGTVVVELKAARALSDAHAAQLLGYLRAARLEHGLLCNFGAPRFEICKYALSSTQDSPSL